MPGIQTIPFCYIQLFKSPSGARVITHTYVTGPDRTENIHASILLAKHGFNITLLPIISPGETELRKKYLFDVYENKNPDVRINDKWLGDFKRPDESTPIRKGNINRMIWLAAQQKVDIAILNLGNRHYAVNDIKKGIIGALQPNRNRSIKFVWIITTNKNLFILNRKEVFDESVYELLHEL